METGLREKTVIVTGGGSNIGRGIVLAFAREGSNIVIADKDEAQAHRTAMKAMEMGAGDTLVIGADVTCEAEVEAMMGRVLEKFGKIEVLVNNVGWPSNAAFLEEFRETLDKEIDLNFRSTIICTKAVIPCMIRGGGGRVVNIGSEAGRTGDPERAVYSACKGAVIALTKAIARDVGRHLITVNCVCPHAIMPENLYEDVGEGSMFHPEKGHHKGLASILGTSGLREYLTKGHALPQMGKPEDIGHAVVFLASDAARFITGQTLSVNGGDYM